MNPNDSRDFEDGQTNYGLDWFRGQVVWYDVKEKGRVIEMKAGRIHAFSRNLPNRNDRAKVKVELVEEVLDATMGECQITDIFFKSLRPSDGTTPKSQYPSTKPHTTVTIGDKDSDDEEDSDGNESVMGTASTATRKRRAHRSSPGHERDRKQA